VSLILYVVVVVKTAMGPKVAAEEVPEIPVAESIRHPQLTPAWLDTWRPWLIGAVVLLVVSYGPQLWDMISNAAYNAPAPATRPW
jgi:cytochrome c oxidase subunit 1